MKNVTKRDAIMDIIEGDNGNEETPAVNAAVNESCL